VVSVFDGSDVWKQNFVWSDEVDGIQMLEQKDVLDYDTDGNTTEVTRSFYHRNALGSVMEITDMNQAAVVSYRYDAYGKVTITRGGTPQTSDPLGQHWAFTARFLDEESGLLYYRARYYDLATGRFLQRDPSGYAAGPNLFEYAGSDPANVIDPSGHFAFLAIFVPAIIKLVVAVVVAVAIVQAAPAVIEFTRQVVQAVPKPDDPPAPPPQPEGPGPTTPEATPIPQPVPPQPVPIPSKPDECPGAGWEWRGPDAPGGPRGGWYNPGTGETLHPDLDHPLPIGPHWDYIDRSGRKWRLPPQGNG
jgi:RHS repeat-associated protein